MAKIKPELRRLVFIDQRIRKGKYPNRRTLAEEYEVSQKTIQRDIEFLRELGAPLEYDQAEFGYYYREENFTLPTVYLDEKDIFAIFIADKALQHYRNTPIYGRLVSVFKKMEQYLVGKVSVKPSWTDPRISFFLEPSRDIDMDIWDTVTESLQEERVLRIEYCAPGHKDTVLREIEPYHMVSYHGDWYVIGLCYHHDEIRTYAVSRMGKAKLLSEYSYIPDDFDLQEIMGAHFGIIYGEKEYKVRLKFNRNHASYIREREWHPSQKVTEHRDGSLTLSLTVNHLYEIKKWILSWGKGVEILSPKELRKDILQEAKGIVACNKV